MTLTLYVGFWANEVGFGRRSAILELRVALLVVKVCCKFDLVFVSCVLR